MHGYDHYDPTISRPDHIIVSFEDQEELSLEQGPLRPSTFTKSRITLQTLAVDLSNVFHNSQLLWV